MIPARSILGNTPRYRRIWKTRWEALNRGSDESLGFAMAHLLAANPIGHVVSRDSAVLLNSRVQSPNVFSMLEYGMEINLYGDYVACYSVDDVVDWIVRKGPVLVEVSGGIFEKEITILASGYWPGHPIGSDVVVLVDSLGPNNWDRGRIFLPMETFKEIFVVGGAPTNIPPRIRVREQEQGE